MRLTQAADRPHRTTRPRAVAAAACLACLGTAVVGAPAFAAPAALPRVVAGTPAPPAQFPYRADLRRHGQGVCGGSLITPDRVLTAAHCVEILRVGDRVVVGPSSTRRIVHLAQDPRLTRLVAAGGSTDDILPYDVGIVQLSAPVTDVKPIRLAQAADADLYAPGTRLTTVGRGTTTNKPVDDDGAGVLRFAEVQARSDADCRALLDRVDAAAAFDPATMLCTTDPDGGAPYRSACYGDSGSPLVGRGPDGEAVQVGLDDWGVACGYADGDPENYVEVPAVAGFALNPAPVFRPEPERRPTFSGVPEVGRRVLCRAPRYRAPRPDRVARAFVVITPRSAHVVGRGAWLRVRRSLRGHRLTCVTQAGSAGGEITTAATAVKRVR